jgi:phage replication-related protein YjqB (UPF0714/DUF867 family)
MITPDAKLYRGYADLMNHQKRGKDYKIVVLSRPSSRVAVIAPHGGFIESRTSEIARAIAADDLQLYLFEGIRPSKNYAALHLTSHFFDEPECLALIAQCQFVVAIHGCKGGNEKILLGGLNATLKNQLSAALQAVNVSVQTEGHCFPATDPNNICNRGFTRSGVQLEFTASLRGSAAEAHVVSAVRSVLVGLNAAA